MGFLDFFTDQTFFPPCTPSFNFLNMLLTNNPIDYYSLKVTTFHGDSVKNESARTKKNTGGGDMRTCYTYIDII